MKTMAVAWNGTTLNDKVKLLSVTELGHIDNTYAPVIEGNRYYIYSHIKNMQVYWLRTRYNNTTSEVWCVAISAAVTNTAQSTSRSLAPCIRLG